MTINTLLNIGDDAFFLWNNRISKATVTAIRIEVSESSRCSTEVEFTYTIQYKGSRHELKGTEVFHSTEALFNHLQNNIE